MKPKQLKLLFLSVLVILAFVAGYKFFSKAESSTLNTSEFSEITDSLLQKHFATQVEVTGYRVISYSSGRGTTVTTTVQIRNEKFLLAAEDFTILDNTIYYYDDNQWKFKALDEHTAQQYLRFDPREVKKSMLESQKTSVFKKIGEEKCGDLDCYKYEQVDPKDPDAVRTFWFDKQTLLLRKDVFTYGEFTSQNEYSYDDINVQVPEIN